MEKVEALDLLEETWFFDNLFNRRTTTRMLRCFSDPYTSPNFSQDVLSNDSCDNDRSRNRLSRAPSLPPCLGREDKVDAKKSSGGKIKLDRQLSLQTSKTSHGKVHEVQEKKIDGKMIKSSGESSSSTRPSLLRTPSLPSSVGTNELTRDNESDLRMSKLIRQALVTSPVILPPRHNHNKAMSLQKCSTRPPRNQEVEATNNTNEVSVTRCRQPNPRKTLRKSHSDLAFQELQGFKDLGFTFDNEDLSPSVISILPGLQGNRIDESEQHEKVPRRPYLSEAWLVPPPIPTCISKNSSQDMKAQIKFWARAVATNVRQEC